MPVINSYFNAPGFQSQFITSPIGQNPYTDQSWNTQMPFAYSGITSPYPQAYNGATPYQPVGQQGFWNSARQLTSPFTQEAPWGNPQYNNQSALDSVSTRPLDATVWAGQRLAGPALAFGTAFKMMGPSTMGGYFTGQGLAAGAGRGIASGIARGTLGSLGAPGWVVGGAEAAAGVAGSFAGAVLIPAAVGYGVMQGAQKLAFDPYIRTRRMGEQLKNNFDGITFGEAQGNVMTGGGLSNREAYGMASKLVSASARDMTFNSDQYLQIADMSTRSGLLDNANSTQIVSRIKGIAEQVKVVMAISKDPDFQKAIEELAGLQVSGASSVGGRFSNAMAAYQGLGRSASIAGTTVQRLMGTVGTEGSNLFSSFGMTPYLGALTSANVYSSMAAAVREGLISPAQTARMGGLENGTQSAMMGMMQGGRSTLMQMGLMNQAFGVGGPGSMAGPGMNLTATVGQFSNNFALDPYGMMGRMALHGDELIARDLSKNGGLNIENSVYAYAQNLPLKRNSQGQIDFYDIVPILMSQGWTKEQIDAFGSMRSAQTDPNVLRQGLKANNRTTQELLMQNTSQNSLYGGFLGTKYRHALEASKSVLGDTWRNVGNMAADALGVGDSVSKAWYNTQFGETFDNQGLQGNPTTFFDRTQNQQFKNVRLLSEDAGEWAKLGTTGETGIKGAWDRFAGKAQYGQGFASLSRGINSYARQGDTNALSVLSAQDNETRRTALGNFLAAHKDSLDDNIKSLLDPKNSTYLDSFANNLGKGQTGASFDQLSSGQGDKYKGELSKITGQHGPYYNLRSMGEAMMGEQKVVSGDLNELNIMDYIKKQPGLFEALGKPKNGVEAMDKLSQLNRKTAEGGYSEIAYQASTMDVDAITKNPNLITDPDIRKKFQAALKKGDKGGMEDALASYAGYLNGGNFKDTKIKNTSGFTDAQVMSQQQILIEDAQKRNQLEKAYKGGMIDYSSYQATLNQLDMKEATQIFSDAVQQFSKTVGNMGSGQSSNSGTPLVISGVPIPAKGNQRTSNPNGGQ
jgi:hypothetical protein